MHCNKLGRIYLGLLGFYVITSNAIAGETLNADTFANVNGEIIPAARYLEEFNKGVRETYYHGKVTEKQLGEFRQKVANKIINHVLLLQQAKQLGIKPNPDQVENEIQQRTKKYRAQKNWEQSKQGIIDSMRGEIETDNVIEQLKRKTQTIDKPSDKAVKQYYQDHLDKFTEPQKWNVSLILLKVDASSPSATWLQTTEQAEELVKKINQGENFEELARTLSGDETAAQGGNMGYIHTGMLSKPAQLVLDKMKVGEVSAPVTLLKGVAIFRLNDMQAAQINHYEDVKDRAQDLLLRELRDRVWEKLVITLRQQASIEINNAVVDSAGTQPRPQL